MTTTKYENMINALRKLADMNENDGTSDYIIKVQRDAADMIEELYSGQHTQKTLPECEFLRLTDVLSIFPVSKTSWYRGIDKGLYPKPINIGMRSVAWHVDDIKMLIEKAKSGGFND